jgi:hypothetical protein
MLPAMLSSREPAKSQPITGSARCCARAASGHAAAAAEKRDELAPSQAVPLGVAAIPDSNLLLSHRAWAGCDVNHAPDTRDEHQRIMRAILEREG